MKLELRRGKPLKGELHLPPDRCQAQHAALLALLSTGRTLLRGWMTTPEWEHILSWLGRSGAAPSTDSDGLVLSGFPFERAAFELDPFLPPRFAAGFLALCAGRSTPQRGISIDVPGSMLPALDSVLAALALAGWTAERTEASGADRPGKDSELDDDGGDADDFDDERDLADAMDDDAAEDSTAANDDGSGDSDEVDGNRIRSAEARPQARSEKRAAISDGPAPSSRGPRTGGGQSQGIRLTFQGRRPVPRPLTARSAAQRTAWILAGLASGESIEFEEPPELPDWLESALPFFGISLEDASAAVLEDGGADAELARRMARKQKSKKRLRRRRLAAIRQIPPGDVVLHGDLDLAAWAAVCATLRRGSDAFLREVSLPPSRIGIFGALRRLGADIEFVRRSEARGVSSGDLRIRTARLVGRRFDEDAVLAFREQAPLLVAAAAAAETETVLRGLGDEAPGLLATLCEGLRAMNLAVGTFPDGLVLRGMENVDADSLDAGGHEGVALAFHAIATASAGRTTLDGADALAVAFPRLLQSLSGGDE